MSKLNAAMDQLQQPVQLQQSEARASDESTHLDADAARHLTAIRIRGQLAEADGDGAQS